MHLKSLTLRGFKSFASATTLRFEPGITCVVGPNGSGKSNVVDAIAWVLGEQGAKSLRGGSMEDVIFAGTAGKPALGRAEVVLTIDNSDGALPLDFSEVTISRLMFRSGQSEYAVNGTPCRLLDVQEMLSDSGIGREMHVIVGQGRLDAVLMARPEERRGFVEEAAGVLKHRKRKEKALRKLDALAGNLTRLGDLSAELSRQLKPLGRQAEVARRAAGVQAELRDARLRLLADDLHGLRSELAAEVADETAVRQRRQAVETELGAAQCQESDLEAALAEATPALARAQDTWHQLSALRERFRGAASLGSERARRAEEEPDDDPAGRDPDELDAEAAVARAEQGALAEELEGNRTAAEARTAVRAQAEAELAAEEQRLVDHARAIADRREGRARLVGDAGALRSRVSAADAEIGRLSAAIDDARARAASAQSEFAALEAEVAGLDEGEVGLDDRHEAAVAAAEQAEARLAELGEQERGAERERSAARARAEALELGLQRRDGSATLLAAESRLPGLRGSVAAAITVETGYERAVAAALGAAADAVAVESVAAAVAGLELLKTEDAGRAGILVGGEPVAGDPGPSPTGTRWASELVTAPGGLSGAIGRTLTGIVVADDLRAARGVVEQLPDLRVATLDGDLIGTGWVAGGAADDSGVLEMQAAAGAARTAVTDAEYRCERLRFAVAAATEERDQAQQNVAATLDELHRSDARMSAVVERLGQFGAQTKAADGEAERLVRAVADAERARDADLDELRHLDDQVADADERPDDAEPDQTRREEMAAACADARSRELEAWLAVRTAEERARTARDRTEGLAAAAVAERQRRERLVAARERRRRDADVGVAAAAVASYALALIERSLADSDAERLAADRARAAADGELLAVRSRVRELSAELDQLVDAAHRDDVARTEQRLRIETLEARAVEEFGVEPDPLIEQYGPAVPVPLPDGESTTADRDGSTEEGAGAVRSGDGPRSTPYDRSEQEKRARARQRDLDQLGKVNPLALEEYDALCERHRYLVDQVADLKDSRRDLLTVIKEVDDRVEQVFAEAFADTAREFEQVFSVLFPGGEGRLLLTEPDDLLESGIDVEARPPGKRVKRLSLLSGGERSLVAIALLVAIFRARPSPFYVLDEVEAALDDRNLLRLLGLLADLRASSQLLVVTHQKRTMEAADTLYGVSMRGDGVTRVVSQRLREADAEPAQPGVAPVPLALPPTVDEPANEAGRRTRETDASWTPSPST